MILKLHRLNVLNEGIDIHIGFDKHRLSRPGLDGRGVYRRGGRGPGIGPKIHEPYCDTEDEAQAAGRLQHRLKVLTYPALLIVDEIGYLPISRSGATLFFQLVNRRYEVASTVLTSNKSFDEWGQILGDDVMAAALIDRLLHHCHIVNIRGNSYRMRQHAELLTALHQESQPREVTTA